MAHYKRGKCRRHGRITFLAEPTKIKRAGLPLEYKWFLGRRILIWPKELRSFYGRSPAKWNRSFHSRPHRARERRVARQVVTGAVDADEALWPVLRKPTIYFW